MSPRIGDLSDRITVEALTGTAWVVQCVLYAMVMPFSPRPASALQASLASIPAFAQAGSGYEITIRYRTDLSRAMRIRRGADVLVITSIDDLDGERRWTRILCETFLSYATRHDTALADAVRMGAAITFTKPSTSSNVPATYDSGTDTVATPAASSAISGYAIEELNTLGYDGATFEQRATRTLVFVPTTYGDLPLPGAAATWNGEDVVVDTVSPIAPNGVTMGARVVVKR